jgi:hypothetical protein
LARFWNRRRETPLEAELRAQRPEPRAEFLASVAAQVEGGRPRVGALRLALAAAFTLVLFAGLLGFGGLDYAAAAAKKAAVAVSGANDKPKKSFAASSNSNNNGNGNGNGNNGNGDEDECEEDEADCDEYEDDKVTICHRTGSSSNPTNTIMVSRNAVPAHLRHGDTEGPCPEDT